MSSIDGAAHRNTGMASVPANPPVTPASPSADMADALARVQAQDKSTTPRRRTSKAGATAYIECIDAADPRNEPATMVIRQG
ncbi:hypothetical protein [Bordetella flabilis]|uniref:Uncharacterized protein n=1 Tax=Bordetella flabilis TaxID=463014 RepID=A0A193G981_9BORD|nr:hypothetical protein [Bordetella flabilis]ANN76026.1 hypothetical protein BAU07_01820 [Bordetella flabilis]